MCIRDRDISDRLVRLPFYNSLSSEDQSRVIETVTSFRPAGRPAPARTR